MNSLDLDIDNYEYDDILKLFNIDIHFDQEDLKNAKRKVLLMHPDKSNLDKKYFLFFSAAYKILFSIYNFREKATISEKLKLPNNKIEYLADKDEYNENIIKNLKEKDNLHGENFNKWFNELFEKVKLDNEYIENGYGNWLKDENNEEFTECKNKEEMNLAIEKKKKILRENSLMIHKDVLEFNNTGFSDITNSKPDSYSSGMFSKLQYEDLKKAHEESVIPVTNDDYTKKYTSFDDINKQRREQILSPLNEKDAENYLKNTKQNDNVINSHRAYKLAKQEEEILKANKEWWASLKQIK